MSEEFELFEGKSLSSLFEDIYRNSVETKSELQILIQTVSAMVKDEVTAVTLVPIIKEYLDINIKNDEHLIKLAMIVQRLIASEGKGASEDAFGMSDAEKKMLLENAEIELDGVRDIKNKVNALSQEQIN